jgi:hypothetical protein
MNKAFREPIKILEREPSVPVNEEDDIGDFLFGEKYIYRLRQKDLDDNEILLLTYFAYFGPNALAKLGCFSLPSVEKFLNDSAYQCPFRKKEQEFFGLYPMAILSQDIHKYRLGDLRNSHYDIAFDVEWTKSMTCTAYDTKTKEKIVAINVDHIAKAYMGHGYTSGTLPYDGSGRIELVKVRLSNGDWLVCATWEWFNK